MEALRDAQAKDTGIAKLVGKSTRAETRNGVHGMVDATSQLFKPVFPDTLVERVVKCLHEPAFRTPRGEEDEGEIVDDVHTARGSVESATSG